MADTQEANSIKLPTVMFFGLGLLLPLWPITLPIFWWLAYRSYKKGGPEQISLHELEKAKALLDSGGLSQQEYDELKKRTSALKR